MKGKNILQPLIPQQLQDKIWEWPENKERGGKFEGRKNE